MRPSPLPVLEAAGVRLVPCGKDRYRCACPVGGHSSNTPAMSVALLRGGNWAVSCFACGFHGNAVQLYAALHGVDDRTAWNALRDAQGLARRLDRSAPVQLHKRPALVLACSARGCGAVLVAEGRTYKVPGRCGGLWETTPLEEIGLAADRAGWEVSADMDAGAVCAGCLLRERASLRDSVGRQAPPLPLGA